MIKNQHCSFSMRHGKYHVPFSHTLKVFILFNSGKPDCLAFVLPFSPASFPMLMVPTRHTVSPIPAASHTSTLQDTLSLTPLPYRTHCLTHSLLASFYVIPFLRILTAKPPDLTLLLGVVPRVQPFLAGSQCLFTFSVQFLGGSVPCV